MPPKPREWTEGEIKNLIRMHDAGYSLDDMARYLVCSRSMVQRKAQELGLSRYRKSGDAKN